MKICFLSAELHPFSKTGGLADVAAALPRALHASGHDVRVFTPLYSRIYASNREFVRVGFLTDIPVRFGGRLLTFTVFTTPLPGSNLDVYFVHCPDLYDRPGIYTSDRDEHIRFALLTRAAIESCQRMGWGPDILHCNDWHTSLAPIYLKTIYSWDALFRWTKTVLTIHNVAYQGIFPAAVLPELGLGESAHLLHQGDLQSGFVSFMKTGILYSHLITTVSETYAREIQTEEFAPGLHDLLRARRGSLVGIVNGVDYSEWNPEADPIIPFRYSARSLGKKAKNRTVLLQELGLDRSPGGPVLGIVSRLSAQKGFDLCFEALPAELARRDIRLAVLGSGDPRLEEQFSRMQQSFPGRVSFYRGYSNELAHLIEAGADMFLMPSRFEPCGLNQMYSLRYGTVPVVRKTGGLADTVQGYNPATGEGTGFVFEHFTADGLRWALRFGFETWRDRPAWKRLMINGMSQDFSWETQGRKYVELYSRLLGR